MMLSMLSGDNEIENAEEWLTEQQIREEDEITVSMYEEAKKESPL